MRGCIENNRIYVIKCQKLPIGCREFWLLESLKAAAQISKVGETEWLPLKRIVFYSSLDAAFIKKQTK